MRCASDPAGTLRCLFSVRIQPCDQFRQILCRKALSCDDQEWTVRDQRDRCEIVEHVVCQAVEGTIQDMGAPLPQTSV